MNKKEILQMIHELQVKYLKYIDEKDWSMASDIHDEIRKWIDDLKNNKNEL